MNRKKKSGIYRVLFLLPNFLKINSLKINLINITKMSSFLKRLHTLLCTDATEIVVCYIDYLVHNNGTNIKAN